MTPPCGLALFLTAVSSDFPARSDWLNGMLRLGSAGQNLSNAAKLGHVDLSLDGYGSVLLQSCRGAVQQSGSARRVTLGNAALHSLLQCEPNAKTREKVHPHGDHLLAMHCAHALAQFSPSQHFCCILSNLLHAVTARVALYTPAHVSLYAPGRHV
jgi:hypothetical protein